MLSVEQLKAISGCNVTRTSKGLRPTAAPCTSISLPTELWVHALEYASLDEAFAAFDVSKAFRSASRFALNKGRWAPVVKVVLAIKSFPWRQYGFAKQKHVDEVKAEFCAAWRASEPRLLEQIMNAVHTYGSADMEYVLGELLACVRARCFGHSRLESQARKRLCCSARAKLAHRVRDRITGV